MPEDVLVDLLSKMFWICLLLSIPPLMASLLVGLVVGLLQAITSIQEQTLTFVPKVVAIVVVFIFAGHWMMRVLMDYTSELYNNIVVFGTM